MAAVLVALVARCTVARLVALVLLAAAAGADYVGQAVEGEVAEGNYTYYTLKQAGDVRLELTSLAGDADLYVAGEEEERPTFLFERHYMSSTTCGRDVLAIPHYLPRPVHIGVYGHPRHARAVYRLEVVIVEEREFDPFLAEQEGGGEEEGRSRGERKGREKEEESDFWTGEQGAVRVAFTILRQILEIVLDIMI